MLGSRLNMIATVIGFGLSATFIVFICTRLIWGRIRRLRSRRRFGIVTRIDLEQAEHCENGIESEEGAEIPITQFNREILNSTKDAKCTICLAEYQDKETLRIMPKCGHNFHLICIDIWLRKHSTCPICRLPIPDSGNMKRNPLSISMPSNSSEISTEHSQHWLLPTMGESFVTGHTQGVSVSDPGRVV